MADNQDRDLGGALGQTPPESRGGESEWKSLSRERWDEQWGEGDFDKRLLFAEYARREGRAEGERAANAALTEELERVAGVSGSRDETRLAEIRGHVTEMRSDIADAAASARSVAYDPRTVEVLVGDVEWLLTLAGVGEHRPDQPQQTMYEVIWGWLAANNPAALELCPYKAKAS